MIPTDPNVTPGREDEGTSSVRGSVTNMLWYRIVRGFKRTGALNVIRARNLPFGVVWWGWGQWYKWRWNVTHIDLGPVSVYEIKRPWLWLPVAWIVKPLRLMYHHWWR